MIVMNKVSIERLHEKLTYKNGNLYWKKCEGDSRYVKFSNTRFAGKLAGWNDSSQGYIVLRIDGIRLKAHRVIYAMHHGEWPEHEIDHINGDRSDNRIENLRAVTLQENLKNQKKYSNNTSGVTGVTKIHDNRYRAKISHDGKVIEIGSFKTLEEAKEKRLEAEKNLGYSASHGVRV